MPMNFAPPYQPMNFWQGNPLFGGQQPPQGMPQQGPMQAPQIPQGMAPQGAPMGANPVGVGLDPGTLQSLSRPARSGGMFAEGGVGRNIAGSIGDYLLQMAHAQPIFAPANRAKQQMAMEEAQYQNHQQSELQRQMAMYKYQMDNPNDEMTQSLRQAGIDPASDQARTMFTQRAQTLAAPMQAFDYQGPDGTVTKQFFRPGPMSPVGGPAATPPPMSEADLIKLGAKPGGPTPQGSATFRY